MDLCKDAVELELDLFVEQFPHLWESWELGQGFPAHRAQHPGSVN